MISQFWLSGARLTQIDAWERKDASIKREYWNNCTPAELIDADKWRKLPAKRRQAIEAAAYKQAA